MQKELGGCTSRLMNSSSEYVSTRSSVLPARCVGRDTSWVREYSDTKSQNVLVINEDPVSDDQFISG